MKEFIDIGFRFDDAHISKQVKNIGDEISRALSENAAHELSAELREGVRQAQILAAVMRRIQTEKGHGIVQLRAELEKAGTSAEHIHKALVGAKLNTSVDVLNTSLASANRHLITMSERVKDLKHVMAQSIKYNVAIQLQKFVAEQAASAVRWTKELNDVLTDISTVAPEVAGRIDVVSKQIREGAAELRVAAKEYGQASLIFFQQGLGIEEVDRRTRITVKAAKVSGQSVAETSEQLTAIWNTYKMQGEQLERSASIAAKLGAETAAAFEDIAEGMQIAASGASLMGVSYESLASMIATVRETTLQSSSTIGNAYKTMFARLTNLKAGGEEAGIGLGKVTRELAALGINVLDQDGNLRQLDSIINQIGTSWDTYSQKQRIAISQTIGGIRQYQQVLALFQNFDKYQRNLISAQAETGSLELERQYAEQLMSLETASVNSAEAWRKAFNEIFSEDSLKGSYAALETIANAVEGIIDGAGGIYGIFALTTTLFGSKLIPYIFEVTRNIKEWNSNFTLPQRLNNITEEFAKLKAAAELRVNTAKNDTERRAASRDLSKLQDAERVAIANANLEEQKRYASGPKRDEIEQQQKALALAHQAHANLRNSQSNYETRTAFEQLTKGAASERDLQQVLADIAEKFDDRRDLEAEERLNLENIKEANKEILELGRAATYTAEELEEAKRAYVNAAEQARYRESRLERAPKATPLYNIDYENPESLFTPLAGQDNITPLDLIPEPLKNLTYLEDIPVPSQNLTLLKDIPEHFAEAVQELSKVDEAVEAAAEEAKGVPEFVKKTFTELKKMADSLNLKSLSQKGADAEEDKNSFTYANATRLKQRSKNLTDKEKEFITGYGEFKEASRKSLTAIPGKIERREKLLEDGVLNSDKMSKMKTSLMGVKKSLTFELATLQNALKDFDSIFGAEPREVEDGLYFPSKEQMLKGIETRSKNLELISNYIKLYDEILDEHKKQQKKDAERLEKLAHTPNATISDPEDLKKVQAIKEKEAAEREDQLKQRKKKESENFRKWKERHDAEKRDQEERAKRLAAMTEEERAAREKELKDKEAALKKGPPERELDIQAKKLLAEIGKAPEPPKPEPKPEPKPKVEEKPTRILALEDEMKAAERANQILQLREKTYKEMLAAQQQAEIQNSKLDEIAEQERYVTLLEEEAELHELNAQKAAKANIAQRAKNALYEGLKDIMANIGDDKGMEEALTRLATKLSTIKRDYYDISKQLLPPTPVGDPLLGLDLFDNDEIVAALEGATPAEAAEAVAETKRNIINLLLDDSFGAIIDELNTQSQTKVDPSERKAVVESGKEIGNFYRSKNALDHYTDISKERTQESPGFEQYAKSLSVLTSGVLLLDNAFNNLWESIGRGEIDASRVLGMLTQAGPGLVQLNRGVVELLSHLTRFSQSAAGGGAAGSIAGFLGGLSSIAVTGGLIALQFALSAIEARIKAHKERLKEMVAESAKAAKTNNDLISSLAEMKASLTTTNKELKDGTISFKDYISKVKELDEAFKQLTADNPLVKLGTTAADFAGLALEDKILALNEAQKKLAAEAQQSAATTQKSLDDLHGNFISGQGRVSVDLTEEYFEEIRKQVVKLGGLNARGSFWDYNIEFDLETLAARWTEVLDGLSNEAAIHLRKEMAKLDGFMDAVDAAAAGRAAAATERYFDIIESNRDSFDVFSEFFSDIETKEAKENYNLFLNALYKDSSDAAKRLQEVHRAFSLIDQVDDSINGLEDYGKITEAQIERAVTLIRAGREDLVGIVDTTRVNAEFQLSILSKLGDTLARTLDETDVEQKIAWLTSLNEQIDKINENRRGHETPLSKLSEDLFLMSEAVRNLELAKLEGAIKLAEIRQKGTILRDAAEKQEGISEDTSAFDKIRINSQNAAAKTSFVETGQQLMASALEILQNDDLTSLERVQRLNDLNIQIAEYNRLRLESIPIIQEVNGSLLLLDKAEQEAAFHKVQIANNEAALAFARQQLSTLQESNIATEQQLADAHYRVALAAHDAAVSTADYYGLDSSELLKYARHLQDIAVTSETVADALKSQYDNALSVAVAMSRLAKGLESAKDNIDDWKAALVDASDIGVELGSETLKEIEAAFNNILGLDIGDLSKEFLMSKDNLDLLAEAANGSVEALLQLQEIAFAENLGDLAEPAKEALQGLWDLWEGNAELRGELGQTFELGDINVSPFIEALNTMLMAGQITADEVNDALSNIGVTPVYEQKEVTSTTTPPPTMHETVTFTPKTETDIYHDGAGGTVSIPIVQHEVTKTKNFIPQDPIETTQILTGIGTEEGKKPQIKGLTVTGPGVANKNNTSTFKGAKPKSKGKGGGGSSKPLEAKKKDFTERYRDTKDHLAEIERRLQRVAAASDKAFGAQRLELLAAQNKLLQEQAENYYRLQKEAERYLRHNAGRPVEFKGGLLSSKGGDQAILQRMLSAEGLRAAVFSQDGFVKNAESIFDEVTEALERKLKSLGAKFDENGWVFAPGQDAALESYNKYLAVIEQIIGQVDKVNKTADGSENAFKRQLENIQNWLTNKIKEVDYKLDLKLNVSEREIKQLQFLLDRLGDRAKNLQIGNLKKQVEKTLVDTQSLIAAYDRLQEIIGNINNITDTRTADHQKWFEQKFGYGAWKEFLDNGGALTEDMINTLLDKADKMQKTIEQLYSYSEQIFSKFHEALSLYLEDFDRLTSTFDNHMSMLESWQSIWQSAGKPWQDQRFEIELLNKAISTNDSKIKGLQERYKFLTISLQKAEKHYKDAVRTHGADDKIAQDSLKNLNNLKDSIVQARTELTSEVASALKQIQEAAQQSAIVIGREFIKGLKGIFSELGSATDMYNQKNAIEKFYLNGEDAGFEIAKMLREVKKEMDGVTDPALIEKHNKWEAYLNGLIEKRKVMTEHLGIMKEEEIWVTKEGVKLTKAQLDIIRAEFELEREKARFADQQAAKNTMRLARDTSGNWSYVYSSDKGEEDGKQDNIEEKLNNIRKLHRQAADESSQMWLQIWTDYRKYIQEIDWQRYNQDEKYRNEVNTRMAWYRTQMDQHSSQIQNHNNAIGRSFNETTLGVITDMDSMSQANDRYKQNSADLVEALKNNHNQYQGKMKETLEIVGIGYDTLKQHAGQVADSMIQSNKATEDSLHKLGQAATEEMNRISQETSSWADHWVNNIQKIINQMQQLIQTINSLAAAQAEKGSGNRKYQFGKDYSASISQGIKAGRSRKDLEAEARELYYKFEDSWKQELSTALNQGMNYKEASEYAKKVSNEWRIVGGIERWNDKMSIEEFVERELKRLGGYQTGGLVTGKQLAWLSEDNKPELVLNAEDTRNILAAVDITRSHIMAQLSQLGSRQNTMLTHSTSTSSAENYEQNIVINADFPNVTAREEIQAAFNNLVNEAAQYKLKPRG